MSRGSKQAFWAQQLQEDQIENDNDLKTKETTIITNKGKTRRQIYGYISCYFLPKDSLKSADVQFCFLVAPTQFMSDIFPKNLLKHKLHRSMLPLLGSYRKQKPQTRPPLHNVLIL